MPERLMYSPKDACRVCGLGMTTIYGLIGAGVLDARKAGAKTLITAESIRRYLESLPKADIRTGQCAAEVA